MATPYSVIYTRAIGLLEDPRITSAFENSPIDFFQIMYGYLSNAIPLFILPVAMQAKLADRQNPSGQIELFNGDGITATFTLSTTPSPNAIFECKIGDNIVGSTYNSITNQVTLQSIPPVGVDNVYTEWYADGQFNLTLNDRQQMILAMLLIRCWSEKEKNFLLDIRRLLNETDFRMISEASSNKAKTDWHSTIREEADKEMNRYSWDIYQANLKLKYGIQSDLTGTGV